MFIFFRRDVFSLIESLLSAEAYKLLVRFGFKPTNVWSLSALLKVFWVFSLTEASWLQMLGLSLYVFSAPLWIIWLFYFRKLKPEEPPTVRPVPFSAHTTLYLNTILLLWFALYGDSSSRSPLIIGLALTAWLLTFRIYQAFIYTSLTEDEGILSRIARAPYRYLGLILKQITSGTIKTDDQLMASASAQRWFLRLLRKISGLLRGRAGKRRAALIVLIQYMSNLVTLGLLTVLFWAIAIKLANTPVPVNILDALWVATSHVIPGVPDAEGIKVSKGIQTGISLTAWAIFVLYAGPVASMYPIFHERYIKQVAGHYQELRSGRVLLYKFTEAITEAYKRVHNDKAHRADEDSKGSVS